MGGRHGTREELKNIVETITEVPRKEGETQREWLARLSTRYGLNRSRTHLQNILHAIDEVGAEDIGKIEEALQAVNRKSQAKKPEAEEPPEREPEIPGQICMQLEPEEKPAVDYVKLMRFQAAQVDKLIMKMDQLNNTMSMVLRAVRREPK